MTLVNRVTRALYNNGYVDNSAVLQTFSNYSQYAK